MKALGLFVLALTVWAGAALAAEFKGTIADSHCAASKGKAVTQAGHADCAAGCIKKGAQAVLVTDDGKVYKLAPQDKVTEHAGHKVTIEGKLEGDTITVDSVQM